MAIKNESAVSAKNKKEEILPVWDLLSRVWSLEYEVTLINKHYKEFHKDMTWSRYGEILMMEDHIPALIESLQKLNEKIQKGARE